MRASAAAPARTHAPEDYGAEALLALYRGEQPDPPLTPAQEMSLCKNGFIARRYGERGSYLIITRKGEDLVEDIKAEREWIEARGGQA